MLSVSPTPAASAWGLGVQGTEGWQRELYDALLQQSLSAVDALNLSYCQAPLSGEEVPMLPPSCCLTWHYGPVGGTTRSQKYGMDAKQGIDAKHGMDANPSRVLPAERQQSAAPGIGQGMWSNRKKQLPNNFAGNSRGCI